MKKVEYIVPQGDLISRADAMTKCKNAENELTDEAERKGLRVARFIIGELPSAERVGVWIEAQIDTAEFPINFLECSECGYRIGRETYLENTFNYCPSCGAKMGEGESE